MDYEYKAAVSLNNMAISMANRCCYDQALETLRGAAFAMKCVTPHSTGANETALQIISNRLLNAYHCQSQTQIPTLRAPVCLISQDETIRFANVHMNTSFPALFLVRIELNDLTSNYNELDLGLPTAIVLYNISVVLLLKAQTETQADQAISFYKNAIDLLGICHRLLHALLDEAGIDHCLGMPSEIGMASTVLKVVFQTLKSFGSVDESTSNVLAAAHSRLCVLADAMQAIFAFCAPAAAAA
jgi:hypothetical protein